MGAPPPSWLPATETHTGEPDLDTLDMPTFGPKAHPAPYLAPPDTTTKPRSAPKGQAQTTAPPPAEALSPTSKMTAPRKPFVKAQPEIDSVRLTVYDWTVASRSTGKPVTDGGVLLLLLLALLVALVATSIRRLQK